MYVNKYLIDINTGVLSENNSENPDYVQKYNDVIRYEERPSNKDKCPQQSNRQTTAHAICNKLNEISKQTTCPEIERIRDWYCEYFARWGQSTKYPKNIKDSLRNLQNDAEELYIRKGGTWTPPPPPSQQALQLQEEQEARDIQRRQELQSTYDEQLRKKKAGEMPGIYF